MKRSKIIWLFVSSTLLGFMGYFLSKVYECGYSVFCYNLFSRIGDPLFYGMAALAIVFLILLFKTSAIGAWKKFAKWYIPIAALVFIFYPNPGSGDFFSPYPEQVFQWLSAAYIIISVIIIAFARKSNPPMVVK